MAGLVGAIVIGKRKQAEEKTVKKGITVVLREKTNRVAMLVVILGMSLSAAANAGTAEADKGVAPPTISGPIKGNVGGPLAGNIGGPFTLVDHNGNTVTDANFHGRYMLIYFGYTFCPAVCPTSTIMMAHALEQLGEEAEKVVPIFITIDPERDRPEVLKEYVSNFHPRLVGLSGTSKQVAVATEAYRVYVTKVFEEGWGVDDYFVYHSDVIYFMGPDGKYLDHFRSGSTPKAMAIRMKKRMRS